MQSLIGLPPPSDNTASYVDFPDMACKLSCQVWYFSPVPGICSKYTKKPMS